MNIKNNFYKQHVISSADLDKNMLDFIILAIEKMKNGATPKLLKNKVIGCCFFEPSTRTRLSFETAAYRMGANVIGFADAENTSHKKGESLADTVRVISSYVDAIIIRHPQEGAARFASEYSSVPIINAGDGANQHPSQTLLDMYSIYECQNQIDNLTIAFVGDLKYGRTVHSLVQALVFYKPKFLFVSPDILSIPNYLLELLNKHEIQYEFNHSIEQALMNSDIIYMTRIQKERLHDEECKYSYSKLVINHDVLKFAKPNLKILHPLPRLNEIAPSVDKTPYAYYFKQAENGIYARMALLALLLNEQI